MAIEDVLIIAAIVFVVFFLSRELWLWYFKINRIEKYLLKSNMTQEAILEELKKLNNNNKEATRDQQTTLKI